MKEPKWDVKVTSKGQITLPKQVRDVMMVREGDRLEAAIQDDSIVLRRRDELPDSEKIRTYAMRNLRNMGIDPAKPCPVFKRYLPEHGSERMESLFLENAEIGDSSLVGPEAQPAGGRTGHAVPGPVSGRVGRPG
jgi:AbrB family looped-hinge helix DNA binding protein